MIQAGFYECDITPAYGMERPASYNKNFIKKINDPLKVSVVVVKKEDTILAFGGVDICFLGDGVVERVREALPGVNILLTASHTHYGGPMGMSKIPEGISALAKQLVLEESVCGNPHYTTHLVNQTVTAIKEAMSRMEDVELSFGKGDASGVTFNRGFKMKNGHRATHPGKCNPDIVAPFAPIDTNVGVVGFWRKSDESFLGCMVNFSCHGTCDGTGATADWPGVMERCIQNDLGFELPVITIIAPQGNINHFDVRVPGSQTGYEEAKRIGKCYAAVVLASLFSMKKVENTAIATASRELAAPYLQLTDEEYAEAKRVYEENKDAVMAGGRDFTSEDIARGVPFVKKFFAERAIGCRENPITERRIERQMMISFGDTAAIVSLPAEPFVEIGYAIREASRFPYTMLAALGMGELGYVGMPYHYGNGGYETSPSRSLADRHVGEAMIEGAIELLK